MDKDLKKQIEEWAAHNVGANYTEFNYQVYRIESRISEPIFFKVKNPTQPYVTKALLPDMVIQPFGIEHYVFVLPKTTISLLNHEEFFEEDFNTLTLGNKIDWDCTRYSFQREKIPEPVEPESYPTTASEIAAMLTEE